MIDKSYELYIPVCDGCGETLEECYTFEGAVDEAKANGWKITKDGDEWLHICPDCLEHIQKEWNGR